eukprot:3511934-Rhodomonas_salina.1
MRSAGAANAKGAETFSERIFVSQTGTSYHHADLGQVHAVANHVIQLRARCAFQPQQIHHPTAIAGAVINCLRWTQSQPAHRRVEALWIAVGTESGHASRAALRDRTAVADRIIFAGAAHAQRAHPCWERRTFVRS